MPSLTDVYLPQAFDYKNDVTITGSTHFIPRSHPQALALFNASSLPHPRKHPVNNEQLCQSHTLKHPPHHHPLQMTVASSSPLFLSTNNSLPQNTTTPPLKRPLRKPHTTKIGHIYPSLHTPTLPLHQDVTRIHERLAFIPRPHHAEFGQVYSINPLTYNHFATPACSNPHSL